MKDGTIYLSELGSSYQLVKEWPTFRWDRVRHVMVGPLTIENLEKIQNFSRGQMPESFCRELRRLRAKKDRLDNERLREDVVPIYDYPVKVKLFKHQLRGANMAMITFDEAEGGGYESSGNSQI